MTGGLIVNLANIGWSVSSSDQSFIAARLRALFSMAMVWRLPASRCGVAMQPVVVFRTRKKNQTLRPARARLFLP